MPISPEAKKMTNNIYKWYGSDSGYLFGIPPHFRSGVEAVVQTAIMLYEREREKTK